MPVTTPQQKIMKTTSFGVPYVEIRLVGDSFDEANRAALNYCEEEGALMVPPFDHLTTICGQATVGKEIVEQFPEDGEIDRIILPVGGGGLSSGVTGYLNEVMGSVGRNVPDFTFVEPDGAP